ncbi:uncharacterized protein LOC105828484 isoform X2 [Monomorium pharaonis]|uniref:uncharacterized protein LOC105828484 isoform X2 n=1 Tax=Monomorium pharaonis TaxID=307658 RepID=UPI00063EE068|nr:uncharacterized protein LOC105828484 isoform X2 [Monomorium pharaonis]XP_036148665.1 uncharacterized protein LOC105828484 isoform X2 [Monomorium pharaonis]
MKSNASLDPWRGASTETTLGSDDTPNDRFEDSFLDKDIVGHQRLSDSEQYLQKLYSRLRVLQGGTTKKDLVTSLSVAKEDCIARLITSGNNPRSEEEAELASNPLIRHIAPHLQALTASELVHLLKADVLEATIQSECEQDITEELQTNQSSTEQKSEDNN